MKVLSPFGPKIAVVKIPLNLVKISFPILNGTILSLIPCITSIGAELLFNLLIELYLSFNKYLTGKYG